MRSSWEGYVVCFFRCPLFGNIVLKPLFVLFWLLLCTHQNQWHSPLSACLLAHKATPESEIYFASIWRWGWWANHHLLHFLALTTVCHGGSWHGPRFLYFSEALGYVKLSHIIIPLLLFYKCQWHRMLGSPIGWPAVKWVFTTRIVAPWDSAWLLLEMSRY